MCVWYGIESSCPVCGRRLELREPGGCIPTGQDSDLLLRMEGTHVIQIAVHACSQCRFSGYADDFLATLRRTEAERFLAEVSPKLGPAGRADPAPDLQYFWAFRCAAFRGHPPRALAERLVRAYWCLRLPPSTSLPAEEAEERRKVYLSGAIHYLRTGPREAPTPASMYLLAELNRRLGDFPAATVGFKRFLDATAGGGEVPSYLRLAAMKLLQASEHSDRRDRTMEEIVYADSPE